MPENSPVLPWHQGRPTPAAARASDDSGRDDAGAPGAAPAAVLGFDREMRCRYATGPVLQRLGIEPRLFDVDLQDMLPALRPVLGSLCRCVFAGAYTRVVFDADGERLKLSGLPLADSQGMVCMALVRIVSAAQPQQALAPQTDADHSTPALAAVRPAGPRPEPLAGGRWRPCLPSWPGSERLA